MDFSSAGAFLTRLDRDQLGELFGGDATSSLPGDVARLHNHSQDIGDDGFTHPRSVIEVATQR